MKCPVDNELMANKQVDVKFLADVHIDICKKCNGVWLDEGELKGLMFHFGADEQKTYEKWLKVTSDGKTEPKDFWQESQRTCPKDGTLLKKHYTGMAHKVGIEQCTVCQGLWFDGGELHAVAKENMPNPVLDNAIRGSLSGLSEELDGHYNPDDVVVWDLFTKPASVIPYIRDALLELMMAFILSRK